MGRRVQPRGAVRGYGDAAHELSNQKPIGTGAGTMAKKATSKAGSKAKSGGKGKSGSGALVERRRDGGGRRSSDNAGDAFIKLLQSPFVAELVAVAATAALAALAEHGFAGGGGWARGKRAGKAVQEAGEPAAP